MRAHISLIVTLAVILTCGSESQAFGRRHRCCSPCVPPPCCSYVCPQLRDCLSIINIRDNQTLGTTFTAYGTIDLTQVPANSKIHGRLESSSGATSWVDALTDLNGGWQIDFTASAGSGLTLRIAVYQPSTPPCSATAVNLTIADGAGTGRTIDQPKGVERWDPKNYQPEGTIYTAVQGPSNHVLTTVVVNGRVQHPADRTTGPKGTDDKTWKGNGQSYDVSSFSGQTITVIAKVHDKHGKLCSVSTSIKVP